MNVSGWDIIVVKSLAVLEIISVSVMRLLVDGNEWSVGLVQLFL